MFDICDDLYCAANFPRSLSVGVCDNLYNPDLYKTSKTTHYGYASNTFR